MRKNEEVDLANLKIVIRFVKKDFSRYTFFIPLFKFSKVFLQLENKFFRILKLNYKPKRYLVPKIADLGVSLICCGIDRFVRTDDEFRVERGLAKSLGFPKGFPTSDTLYRFFKAFNGYNIRQLERVNLEVLKEQKEHWYFPTGSVFVDLDMNTKSVEGKQIEKAMLGYNRKSPGRLSLAWTVGHIAKVALYSELHTGKTSGRTVLRRQIEHLEKLMKKLEIKESRIVWRVDGGYFSGENLRFLNERRFLMRVPKNLKVLQGVRRGDLPWYKYGKHSEYTDVGGIDLPELGLNLRLVLVKTHRQKKVLLYPLIGNLFNWKAESIVKAYRGRQIVENCFRDTNQAFYSNKLPSSSFQGNQAFLWLICLAYNQFFFFQKLDQGQTLGEIDSQETFSKISQKSRGGKVSKKAITARNIRR